MCWEGYSLLCPTQEALPKKGLPFLRLDVYEIVRISQVVGYGREGKLSFLVFKGTDTF